MVSSCPPLVLPLLLLALLSARSFAPLSALTHHSDPCNPHHDLATAGPEPTPSPLSLSLPSFPLALPWSLLPSVMPSAAMYVHGDGYMLDATLMVPAVMVSGSLSIAGEDVGQAVRQMRARMDEQQTQIATLTALVGRLLINVSASQQLIAEQAEAIEALQASVLNTTSDASQSAAYHLHARLTGIESLTGSSALVANVTAHALAVGLHATTLAQLSGLSGNSLLTTTVVALNTTVGAPQGGVNNLQQRLLNVETLAGTTPLSNAVNAHNGTLHAISGLTGTSALVSSLSAALNLTGSSLLATTVNGLSSSAALSSSSILALKAANVSLSARVLDAETLTGESSLVITVDRLSSSMGRLSSCNTSNTSVSVGCLCISNADTNSTTSVNTLGNFTSRTINNGGISANSLAYPSGVTVDASNNVYVADRDNNRVLYYPSGSTTATRVYGQGGSFITGTSNNGGISANSNSLYTPWGVAVDASDNVYVADFSNHRVLYYPSGSTTATRVYGQS